MSNDSNSGKKITICTDETVMKGALKDHAITEQKYNDMVQEFCTRLGAEYPPLDGPRDFQIDAAPIDLTLDCTIYGIKFSFDNSTTTNNDIIPSMDLLPTKKNFEANVLSDTYAFYSIQLFNALKILKNADHFDVRKAIETTVGNKKIFSIVLRAFIGTDTTPVYYGDLTSQIPK